MSFIQVDNVTFRYGEEDENTDVLAGVTLHVRELAGANSHHIIEAAFKAVGRAMRHACEYDARVRGIPSTKGSL